MTADFGPGDCLIFGMHTFYDAFDNHSEIARGSVAMCAISLPARLWAPVISGLSRPEALVQAMES